ncbi:MAG: pyruvate kinase [Actinomycetota bacterium]|nr:pyruvate kinase [Actinomycetota bacterium]
MKRKTKIVGTLGPAVDSLGDVRRLIESGLNVARFNFSHGTAEDHARRHEWVRIAASEAGVSVATMQDIQGPKIRVGTFPAGSITLAEGADVTLEPGEGEGDRSTICIAYLERVDLQPGSEVLLADGMIRLEVASASGGRARTRVVGGGELFDHKGAAFPGSDSAVPVITEKDVEDLAIGREIGFDLIAASFVSSGEDIRDIRRHVGYTPIIAKIESVSGYRNLDDVLTEADGAMVARGDLGVELNFESVPRAQKEILERANSVGKITIIATEMLESMISNPRPTRAEVSDVYRSVLDGTDAVMLSAETAIGAYPGETIRAMAAISREAEQSPEFVSAPYTAMLHDRSPYASAVAQAAVETANRLGVDTIVAFTESGTTARLLSKHRPRADVYAFTPHEATYRLMALFGCITPLHTPTHQSTDEMLTFAEEYLLEHGIARTGDTTVMVAGIPPNLQASTNLMKVHRVGSATGGTPRH